MTLLSKLVAAVFVTLGLGATAARAQEDPALKAKVAMCIGCHGIPGYQASFPEVHRVPMIAGQSEKYIAAALQAYRKGDRRHPTMRAIAEPLSDADIDALAGFYAKQAGPITVPDAAPAAGGLAAELLTKGNCASCHGANFSKPIDPSYPKLAGQHADYLYVAMKAYQIVNTAKIGRNHAVMGPQVKALSHAELKALAAYFASLPSELRTVPEHKFR